METVDFRIIIPNEALTEFHPDRSHSSCPIWVQLGDLSYPDEGWWDAPLVILHWWASSLLSLPPSNATATFMFFEGPYNLLFRPEGEHHYSVTPREGGFLYKVPREQVHSELTTALTKVLSAISTLTAFQGLATELRWQVERLQERWGTERRQ